MTHYFAPAPAPTGRKRGAELVFIERLDGTGWYGRLVARDAAIDRQTGKPAEKPSGGRSYRALISTQYDQGRIVGYYTTTRGSHVGSTRHSYFHDVASAQRALQAWARRRFYVVVP